MIFFSKKLGEDGEELAVNFLKRQGYKILDRNFRSKWGEIDIIAQDRDIICFIEVKTRTNHQFGAPVEAVSFSKQNKMTRTALYYLTMKEHNDVNIRFDVIGVDVNNENKNTIDLIKNAFDMNG